MDEKERSRALGVTLSQIEKQFGKGSILRLGSKDAIVPVSVISSGSISLDYALGAGGFGTVYLAHDVDIERQVALKVLHPERLRQPGVVDRFQREACATARLRHAGIVQLYDYSRRGPPY